MAQKKKSTTVKKAPAPKNVPAAAKTETPLQPKKPKNSFTKEYVVVLNEYASKGTRRATLHDNNGFETVIWFAAGDKNADVLQSAKSVKVTFNVD